MKYKTALNILHKRAVYYGFIENDGSSRNGKTFEDYIQYISPKILPDGRYSKRYLTKKESQAYDRYIIENNR